MCQVNDCIKEGRQAYIHLKQFFDEPEKAIIDIGHYTVCNKSAWMRGFKKELWRDEDRWKFLQRCEL